jgi:two-component system response regulator RpfG
MSLATGRLKHHLSQAGRKLPGTGGPSGTWDREGQRAPTVLIIDDQSTARKILEELVRGIEKGLVVKSFSEPFEALEWARRHISDLVLTDYKMPLMDGVEFTRRFRAIPACADVPIIMVTIVEDRRIRYQALEAGATDFLTRPIDHYECQARCRNLLTLRKQQKIIECRAKWLEQQVAVATRQIRTREQETLLRLAKAGEYRDEETGNHILRMARYSRLIAVELALTEAECDEIELAAPMHDIGKIGIPDDILLKRSKLTPEEFRIIQTHPTIGYEILRDSPSKYLQVGAIIAYGHHEKYDGEGYPQGLCGEDIPLQARIVAVADVFDALSSVRPYKRAWSIEQAVAYIDEQRGRHFDPRCAEAFLDRLDRVREIQRLLGDTPAEPEVLT